MDSSSDAPQLSPANDLKTPNVTKRPYSLTILTIVTTHTLIIDFDDAFDSSLPMPGTSRSRSGSSDCVPSLKEVVCKHEHSTRARDSILRTAGLIVQRVVLAEEICALEKQRIRVNNEPEVTRSQAVLEVRWNANRRGLPKPFSAQLSRPAARKRRGRCGRPSWQSYSSWQDSASPACHSSRST